MEANLRASIHISVCIPCTRGELEKREGFLLQECRIHGREAGGEIKKIENNKNRAQAS